MQRYAFLKVIVNLETFAMLQVIRSLKFKVHNEIRPDFHRGSNHDYHFIKKESVN